MLFLTCFCIPVHDLSTQFQGSCCLISGISGKKLEEVALDAVQVP